jgi:hypothetical protein
MRIWIDGEVKIDEVVFEAGSVRRETIERGVCGLDGICSIDLGSRGRDISIEGVLRAASGIGLDSVIEMIEAKMDEGVCKLSINDVRDFGDVRIDVFETSERQFGGSSVTCKCKLLCKQLKVM